MCVHCPNYNPMHVYYTTVHVLTLRFLYLMDIHEIGSDSLVEFIYMAMAYVIVLFPHTQSCTRAHGNTSTHHPIPVPS